MPVCYQGPWLVANATNSDSTPAMRELGIEFRPLDSFRVKRLP